MSVDSVAIESLKEWVMLSADQYFHDDETFWDNFCTDTTVDRLRNIPLSVLRESVRYLYHHVGFGAAASPRLWTPYVSPQPVVVFGKMARNGRTFGRRFGLCTDTDRHSSEAANALYVWADKLLIDGFSSHSSGERARAQWVNWRHERRFRLKMPIAELRGGAWQIDIEKDEILSDFLERIRSTSDSMIPTEAAVFDFRPVMQALGQSLSFITPLAVDIHRHPEDYASLNV